MKHSWWQTCQPLLDHFLKSIFYMLYTISKLRKSILQCFKRYAIWSWNEGVTAIASQSLQDEGRILHSAAKSPFCCEMISQPFCTVLCFPPEVSRHDGSRMPQVERPLHSVVKLVVCCEVISQPFLCVCEILQTSFFTCEMVLSASRYFCTDFLDLFFRYFCINFHSSPCNPPTIRFLS